METLYKKLADCLVQLLYIYISNIKFGGVDTENNRIICRLRYTDDYPVYQIPYKISIGILSIRNIHI